MIEPLELDDLRYDDLVAQARALIPSLCPEWTDHNPSDVGITLLELFAWLTEMVGYRLNRVPEKSYRVFLNLLDGSPLESPSDEPPKDLDDAIRQTVASLRELDRVVTLDDLAYLIREKWPRSQEAKALGLKIHRVRCVPGRPKSVLRDLQLGEPSELGGVAVGVNTRLGEERISLRPPEAAHISAIVISELSERLDQDAYPLDPRLLTLLEEYLAPRLLITTRLHVIGPRVVQIWLSADLHLSSDGRDDDVRNRANQAIREWFHPLSGGPDRTGWPFGRSIHVSDLYEVLDGVPGLDYVEAVKLWADGDRTSDGVDMSDFEIAVMREGNFTIHAWTAD